MTTLVFPRQPQTRHGGLGMVGVGATGLSLAGSGQAGRGAPR
jgi:hypothetical protein